MPVWTDRPVVFIGLMATGKSTLGLAFAARHRLPFIDTDQLITGRHGPIPELFTSRGEKEFRVLEARAAAEVLAPGRSGLVVSLGGGAVLDPGTRSLLRRTHVVWLDADLDTVAPRIARDRSRPLLAADPLARWAELHTERRPVYQELADTVLDIRGRTVEELLNVLDAELEPQGNERRTSPHGS